VKSEIFLWACMVANIWTIFYLNRRIHFQDILIKELANVNKNILDFLYDKEEK
jgi:hypothetical protein